MGLGVAIQVGHEGGIMNTKKGIHMGLGVAIQVGHEGRIMNTDGEENVSYGQF